MKAKSKPQMAGKRGESGTARIKHKGLTKLDTKAVKGAMKPVKVQKGI